MEMNGLNNSSASFEYREASGEALCHDYVNTKSVRLSSRYC